MTTAAIEAMATGLALIATKHSGFPDQVVVGKNGYLANEADPEDFAEKMLTFMNEPERWPEMSDFSRAHALTMYDQKPLIDRQLAHYQRLVPNVKKVAFIVGVFPAVSETWLINQIADLIDRGVAIEIYAFKDGGRANISDRYVAYQMEQHTRYLNMPDNHLARFLAAIPKLFHLLFADPKAFMRAFNIKAYGADAYSLKNLFWAEPLIGIDADVVHCHYGTIALRYLRIREIFGLERPFITSFYGRDVSNTFKESGPHVYDELIRTCPQFLVMSNNMKERILPYGFPPERVEPLPISLDVERYPFARRSIKEGETMKIVSVGRFVEKKGFDDLVRAAAILKKKAPRPFSIHIIGGGALLGEIKALAKELDVQDVVKFEGAMKVQDITKFFMTAHLYVQPSKTARDGDME